MKKRDVRLAGIYQAAAGMICRNGYEATTLGEIAKAVGLTKAGLYHYFPSKEKLLFSMVNYEMDRVETEVIDPVRGIADPQERLRALTYSYVNLVMETGGDLTRAINESHKLQRTRARKVEKRRRALFDFVRQLVQELKDAGALSGIRVGPATLSYFGVILFVAEWHRPSDRMTRAEIADQVVRLAVDRMLLP